MSNVLLRRNLYLLPAVETQKGTFFIRNYFNEETNESGVIIYNENGDFITERPGMKYKENDEYLIDRMTSFIETSSLF
jgi:hypothetical protein